MRESAPAVPEKIADFAKKAKSAVAGFEFMMKQPAKNRKELTLMMQEKGKIELSISLLCNADPVTVFGRSPIEDANHKCRNEVYKNYGVWFESLPRWGEPPAGIRSAP